MPDDPLTQLWAAYAHDRRILSLGHDWPPGVSNYIRALEAEVKQNRALMLTLQTLRPGERVRAYRLHEGKGETWVFKDYRPDPESFETKVQYFANGAWHDTVEGVSFSEIEPWLKSLFHTSPGPGSSPSTPRPSDGSSTSPTAAPESPLPSATTSSGPPSQTPDSSLLPATPILDHLSRRRRT